MEYFDVIRDLKSSSGSTVVLLVLDGLADVATKETDGRTPLEAARTPNLDRLSLESAQGRLIPVGEGITPGSGPGHLGLFGYDPLQVTVGRGVIEALGLDMDVPPGCLAARGNFATVSDGVVTDRRAGRIPDALNVELCARLREIEPIDGVRFEIHPGKSHRFAILFHGDGMAGPLTDSDSGKEGESIHEVRPVDPTPESERTARVVNAFWRAAGEKLSDRDAANGVLLRGIGTLPEIESFVHRFGLTGAAVAAYPMYRGLAQLVGMTKIPTDDGPEAEFATWARVRGDYDFGFIHIKATDMYGEDGNFEGKVGAIEAVDRHLPDLLATEPGVLAITGDHSTPVPYRAHGWQAVPVLVHAERAGMDGLERFTERTAVRGTLGTMPSCRLMPVLLASAGRLGKFGA